MRSRILSGCMLFIATSIGISANNQSGYIIRKYKVKPNDTLQKIAKKRNTTVEEILKYNNIENPNLLHPGMEIKIVFKESEQWNNKYNNIPKKVFKKEKEVSLSQPVKEVSLSQPVIDKNFYTVVKNDTLTKIAKKFGIGLEELIRINNIKNPDLIYRGQILKIREDEVKKAKVEVEKLQQQLKQQELDQAELQQQLEIVQIEKESLTKELEKEKLEKQKLEQKQQERKILKVEISPNSFLEIYYKGELLGYKTSKSKEMLEITGDKIKAHNKFDLKLFKGNGKVEEKKVEILEKDITFITFLDKNGNKELDIEDDLITEGTLNIDGRTVEISPYGDTVVPKLQIDKNYQLSLDSQEKNIFNKKLDITIKDEKIFIPIESSIFSINGKIKLVGKSLLVRERKVFESLLLRLKNKAGIELFLLPINDEGKFYIEELPKGEYLYDIECLGKNKMETIVQNNEITVENGNIEIKVDITNRKF